MKSSTAQTLGIILAVLAFLMAVGFLRVLIGIPLGIIDGGNHGWIHRGGGHWFWPFSGFFDLAAFVVWILAALWAHRDAQSRGMEGIVWGLIVFFLHILGLIIYLIVRTNHPVSAAGPAERQSPVPPAEGEPISTIPAVPRTLVCKSCGRPVENEHGFCAVCGRNINPVCAKCGKETQQEWRICPFCGEKIL